MARGESRGGGYDKATDEKAKKAFSTQSRQTVGAQANAINSSAEMAAPRSLGELMTPSTFGREGPPVDETDLQQRQARNEGFLKDPNTVAMITQFGMNLLSGRSIGTSMKDALGGPARMAAAQGKAEEQGLDITSKKLDILKKTKELTDGPAKTPSELMKILNEAEQEELAGNTENAAILRSRAYQMSQEFSLKEGTMIKPPSAIGNAGDATNANAMPEVINIPGGKADLEKQAADAAVANAKMKDIQDGILVGASVDNIVAKLSSATFPSITSVGVLGGSGLMNYLSQNSADISASLDTIKAKAGFAQLQAMRNASKTGGALGQVSDFENKLLASTIASLAQTQDKDQFLANLKTVQWIFNPQAIDARAQISKALEENKIDISEATNLFNAMYREAVVGSDAETKAPTVDMAVPPSYVSDKMKEVWSVLSPEEKAGLLNDEDKAAAGIK